MGRGAVAGEGGPVVNPSTSKPMADLREGVWINNAWQKWPEGGTPATARYHRDERDPKTGLVLPAQVDAVGNAVWWRNGLRHRDDRDPETGLVLPSYVCKRHRLWHCDGKLHRTDRDPETGRVLPAVWCAYGKLQWFIDGEQMTEQEATAWVGARYRVKAAR